MTLLHGRPHTPMGRWIAPGSSNATSDKVDTGATSGLTLKRTVMAWIYLSPQQNVNNIMRIADKNTGADELFYRGNADNIVWIRAFTGGNGDWQMSFGNTANAGKWVHVAGTQDGTTTPPIMYRNAIPMSVSTTLSPIGTPVQSSAPTLVGNNASNTRAFTGAIADYCEWEEVLDAAEIRMIALQYRDPRLIRPDKLRLACDLGRLLDHKGRPLTAVGTSPGPSVRG